MREYQYAEGGGAVLGSVFTEHHYTLGTLVVTVAVTLVGLFGLILLMGIAWCCCAKRKSPHAHADNEEASRFIARKPAEGDGSHGDGAGDVSIPVEGTLGNDKNGNEKTRGSAP